MVPGARIASSGSRPGGVSAAPWEAFWRAVRAPRRGIPVEEVLKTISEVPGLWREPLERALAAAGASTHPFAGPCGGLAVANLDLFLMGRPTGLMSS